VAEEKATDLRDDEIQIRILMMIGARIGVF
jgi:hypothetical protein